MWNQEFKKGIDVNLKLNYLQWIAKVSILTNKAKSISNDFEKRISILQGKENGNI